MIRRLKNLKHLLVAFFSALFYRFPARQLTVVGVTGTDGKTTTVNLITHLLASAGLKVAMISTVGAKVGKKEIKLGFHVTTPDSRKIQRLLRSFVDQGIKIVVIEATSHGLDQHRLWGIDFQVGVITNVTHEHLDYHHTYENYLRAKAKLFQGIKQAILNRDDRSWSYLAARIKGSKETKIISYGIKKKADLTPKNFPFKTKLPGEYNRYNCLAAIAVARIFKIKASKIRQALLSFSPVKGRLEEVRAGQSFKMVVDFAHTPNAFKQIIPTVRRMTKGKIIHVFGCTGDRDPSKRPIMGKIAAQLSDKIILTHEDSYSESPTKIMAEIEPGVKSGGKIPGQDYWKVARRGEAIKQAVKLAKKGDTILITGVGHQTTLNVNGQEIPWSDQKAAEKAIKERINAKEN